MGIEEDIIKIKQTNTENQEENKMEQTNDIFSKFRHQLDKFNDLEEKEAGPIKTAMHKEIGAEIMTASDPGGHEDYIEKIIADDSVFPKDERYNENFRKWLRGTMQREYFIERYWQLYKEGGENQKNKMADRQLDIINNKTTKKSSQDGRIKRMETEMGVDFETIRHSIIKILAEDIERYDGPVNNPDTFMRKRDYLLVRLQTNELDPTRPEDQTIISPILKELETYHFDSIKERQKNPATGSGELLPGVQEENLPTTFRDREREMMELYEALKDWSGVKKVIEKPYKRDAKIRDARQKGLEHASEKSFDDI